MPPVGDKKPASKPKATKPTAQKPVAQKPANRKLEYPEIVAESYLGDKALTAAQAKVLLGWEIETEDEKFGEDFFLFDHEGNKVRLTHNEHNRPFDLNHALKLGQDILNRNWADSRNGEDMSINGETMSITKYGDVDSGQHRLIALVLAVQSWNGYINGKVDEDLKKHWHEKWEEEPTMEALIVFGVSSNPRVTRTIDNVKPRSLADVVHTEEVFAKYKKDGAALSKMLAYALTTLWRRTGAGDGIGTDFQTHSESINFMQSHPSIMKAVTHIFTENGNNTVVDYLPLGTAASMLYMMAACEDEMEKYVKTRSEKSLKLAHWDEAKEFWSELAKGSPKVNQIRKVKRPRENDPELVWGGFIFPKGDKAEPGSIFEKTAALIKAWGHFLNGKNLTEKNCELTYELDLFDDGTISNYVLEDAINLGGIDPLPDAETETDDEDEKPDAEETAADKATQAREKALRVQLAALKAKHPGKVLAFKTPKAYVIWGEDAEKMAKVLGLNAVADQATGGIMKLEFPHALFRDSGEKIIDAGHKFASVVMKGKDAEVTDFTAGE